MSGADAESALVDRAVAGDRAALSQLLLLHFDDLHQHVESRISPRLRGLMRADDVLQQTFLAGGPGHRDIRGASPGCFPQLVADDCRQPGARRGEASPSRAAVSDLPASWGGRRGRGLDAGGDGPVGRVDDLAQRPRATARGGASPAGGTGRAARGPARSAPTARTLLGQSLDEIATATGRTRGAVRGLCFRGRQNLRSVMGQSSLYFSR